MTPTLKRRRGNILVELIFLLPFYGTALFGVIEFGQAFHHRIQLTTSCREAVRRTAVGKTLSEIRATAKNTYPQLEITDNQILIEQNATVDGTGAWSGASDGTGGNSIPVGYPCRVRVVGWRYRMITGSYFGFLPGFSEGSLPMSAAEVMIRE